MRYVPLETFEISRIILLHETVTVRSAKVEDVVRTLIEETEVILYRPAQIFVDDLRVLPVPRCVEKRVADSI